MLWASLLRPIAELAEGKVRLADIYPDAVQSWTGYLQKGVVGVLSTLVSFDLFARRTSMTEFVLMYQMFQGLTHPPQSNSHLKAPALFPIIMTALDNMYKHPGDFSVFFKEAHELLFLKSVSFNIVILLIRLIRLGRKTS